MRLLDSNILIYAAQPENEWLRLWLESEAFGISTITRIEVLGYHQIAQAELEDLQLFLAAATEISLDDEVTARAIRIRQQHNIALADAVIAATALAYDWELVTRNVDDFRCVDGLKLLNPFDHPGAGKK